MSKSSQVSECCILRLGLEQAGLISGTVYSGTWGSGQMIANNNSWTTTIPASVPSGNYLIRFETIALHSMPAVSLSRLAHIRNSHSYTLRV